MKHLSMVYSSTEDLSKLGEFLAENNVYYQDSMYKNYIYAELTDDLRTIIKLKFPDVIEVVDSYGIDADFTD